MLSRNTDRFWTIMFTIPLPLMLGSVLAGQEVTVDPEPVLIATQTAIKPATMDATHSIFHVPRVRGRVDQSAERWSHQTSKDKLLAMNNAVDSLRLIHPTTRQATVAPMKIGISHSNRLVSDVKATPEQINTRRHDGIGFAKPRQRVVGHDAVTRIRCDKFVSFDSQAPPRDPSAIAFATASKYLLRIPANESSRGAQPPSKPSVHATNLIRLDHFATSGASIFIPPNDSRRPQRFRIKSLVLAQSS
jgi:hypothetical protein